MVSVMIGDREITRSGIGDGSAPPAGMAVSAQRTDRTQADICFKERVMIVAVIP